MSERGAGRGAHLMRIAARPAVRWTAGLFCASVATSAFAQTDILVDRDRADRRAPGVDLSAAPAPRRSGRVETDARPLAPVSVRNVVIEGSSLPPAAFEPTLAPLRGATIDAEGLSRLATAIANIYAESDVALYAVSIPQQDFADGVVRVVAIEGHISDVVIGGDTDGNVDLVRHYAAGLVPERPLTRATMERQLLLISDINGLETKVQMAPAADYGGMRLGLDLDRQRFTYGLGIADRGDNALGRIQVSVSATANGLFRLGEQTSLTLAADSEFDRMGYAAFSHREPIGHDGASVTLRLSTLETQPGDGGDGSARTAGVLFAYPAIRSYRRNLTLSAGLDGLNSDNAFLGFGTASERTRVLRFAAAHTEVFSERSLVLSGALSQGLDDMGARSTDPAVSIDFTKLTAQAGYGVQLGSVWTVQLSAAGQVAGDVLPASEQFALGGTYGRAFGVSEVVGDKGLGAAAELSRQVYASGAGPFRADVFGFADGGRVWTERGAGETAALASAGLGMRLRFTPRSAADFYIAQAIDEPFADEPRGVRFGFNVNANF